LFSISKITKDDFTLINVYTLGEELELTTLFRKFSGKNWAGTSVDRLLKKTSERQQPSAISSHVGILKKNDRTCGGAHLQPWKCSTHPQKSVGNWKEDGHFTVICSAYCKAWSLA